MIYAYQIVGGKLTPFGVSEISLPGAMWIDLVSPTNVEERQVEEVLGIDIPTREEMDEIEISSRLYQQNGVAFLTAVLLSQADGENFVAGPVSFVLDHQRLITVRYHEPRVFQAFAKRASLANSENGGAEALLIALLEAVVDRLADVLERTGQQIDLLSRDIFQHKGSKPTKSQDFKKVLEELGRKGDLTSNIRDSILSLERLIGFLTQISVQRKSSKENRERIKTIYRDLRSLGDHVGFMSQKITFLLDATLGMINIEQNAIIKIFSVAAVVFLPPTLIASIYGMNFDYMPELKWLLGYPFAIGLMVASAIGPYLLFKRRGWL